MWQQHDESTLTHPLSLTTRDKLINNNLGVVTEISKLPFPHYQRIWIGHRVAQLKAQDGLEAEN